MQLQNSSPTNASPPRLFDSPGKPGLVAQQQRQPMPGGVDEDGRQHQQVGHHEHPQGAVTQKAGVQPPGGLEREPGPGEFAEELFRCWGHGGAVFHVATDVLPERQQLAGVVRRLADEDHFEVVGGRALQVHAITLIPDQDDVTAGALQVAHVLVDKHLGLIPVHDADAAQMLGAQVT